MTKIRHADCQKEKKKKVRENEREKKKGLNQMNQRRCLLEKFNLHILYVRHIGKNVKK